MTTARAHLTVLFPLTAVIVLLLAACSGVSSHNTSGSSLAVWKLDDLSPVEYAQPDLGELLSGRIMETVQNMGTYSLIERERLQLALEELNLGTQSFVDERTRLKLGQLTGARYMVFGGYQVIGDTMRLDLRLVHVETGRVRKAVQKTTAAQDISGWLESARLAAEDLL